MKKFIVTLIFLPLVLAWSVMQPAIAATNTYQVNSAADAVNEDGTTFTANANPIWLGNGGSKTTSYTGIRFTNVSVPNNATITSAKLMVYSTQTIWIGISMSMAADLSPNSPAFSSTSRPSQRTLTVQKVNHNSNISWSANTWYTLDEMAPVLQEIVSQKDWQSGNSLSILLLGTGNSWGRKYAAGWSGTTNNAPKLVISYSGGIGGTSTSLPPTATSTSTPASSATPASSSTPTATGLPPTSTSTPTPTFTPTRTNLPPTPTSTALPPSSTPTRTSVPPTPTPGASNSTSFSVGAGWADSVPHQVVRTADDRLYFFGSGGESSAVLHAYWTTNPGLPNQGSDFGGSLTLNTGANILSTAVIYDGAHIIHVLTNGQNGQIIDRPFDTAANQFKTAKVLDTSGGTVGGYYIGTAGLAGMMDQSANLHMVFWSSSNHITYRAYTYNVATDSLTLVDGPTQIDASGSANHPALAVSPLDGSITVAWVSQASSPPQILARTKRSGSWGSLEIASTSPVWTSADSGINIDQSPSLVIGADGKKYLTYIENWRVTAPYDYGRIHFVSNPGSGWTDQYIGSYTHDPAIAINSAGQIDIIGHGYPLNAVCTSVDDLCVYARNSDGTWAAPRLFRAHTGSQSFDSSTSVKWSVVGYNRPDVIEFFIAEVGGGYNNPILYYGRIGTN